MGGNAMKSKAPRARGKAHIVVCFVFPHSMGKSKKRDADFVAMSFAGYLAREESDDIGCCRYYLIPIGEGTLAHKTGAPVSAVFEAFQRKKIHVGIFTNRAEKNGKSMPVGSLSPFSRGEGELPAHAKQSAIRRAVYRQNAGAFAEINAAERFKTESAAMELCKQFETMDATLMPVCTYIVNGNRLSAEMVVDSLSVYGTVDAELDRRKTIRDAELAEMRNRKPQ